VNVDDVLVVIETDKVSVDVRSPEAGVLEAIKAEEGAVVDVGAPLLTLRRAEPPEGGAPAGGAAPKEAPVAREPAPSTTPGPVQPAPTPAPAPAPSAPQQQQQPPVAAPPMPAFVGGAERTETRTKMNRMRQRISQRLKDSQNTAAMLTTFQEVDMSNLIAMRKEYKEPFEKRHGVKLGFMSAFVKASASALEEVPVVNSVIDGDEIVQRNYADISVAVATPRGLVVPVVRNCEHLSFADIEKTIAGLAAKARNNDISLEDMAGGTFTISNGGVYGSLFGTPIINPPQSAILGMHATKMRPVAVNGEVKVRPVMYLALTYDHRLIDGREAVTFLCSIRDKIEDPRRMLLGL